MLPPHIPHSQMAGKMASFKDLQSQAEKMIVSQSEQHIPQGAFESKQPLAPLPNTLDNMSATLQDGETEEKQVTIDSFKSK
jgi:hypothetical protein